MTKNTKDVKVTQKDIDGISFALDMPVKEVKNMKIKAKAFSDEDEAREFSDKVTLITMKFETLDSGEIETTVFYKVED